MCAHVAPPVTVCKHLKIEKKIGFVGSEKKFHPEKNNSIIVQKW